jgi:DNA-binding transcriptional regulator YhcF (GntR family)
MLEGLFGNVVVEKVLFYLNQNQTSYPRELSRTLEVPLYSIQKALDRLEGTGILVSYRRGKTLLYEFNPRYPFLKELKAFLDKAFMFLPEDLQLLYSNKENRKRPRKRGKPD